MSTTWQRERSGSLCALRQRPPAQGSRRPALRGHLDLVHPDRRDGSELDPPAVVSEEGDPELPRRARLAAPDALGRTNYASVILAAVPTENPRRSARRSRYRRIGQGTFDPAPWEAPGRTAKLHKVAPSIPGWFRNGLRRSAGC